MRRVLAVLGFAVVLLVTLALVVFALTRTPSRPSGDAQPIPIFSSAPTALPTAPPDLPVVDAFLIAFDSGSVWRGSRGACESGSAWIQSTDDDGVSWSPVTATQVGLGEVLAFDSDGADQVQAVIRTAVTCELEGARSFTGGDFWESDEGWLTDASFLDRNDLSTLVLDGALVAAPCQRGIQMSFDDEYPGLLCDDGSWFEWRDGAWSGTTVSGAFAFGGDESTVAFAVRDVPGCVGTAVVTLPRPITVTASEPAATTYRACITSETSEGRAAIDVNGSTIWFTDPSGTQVSRDDGSSWSPVT